jgi:hypothetical protein
MTWRWNWSPVSTSSACAPMFCGRRIAGSKQANRLNANMVGAGATVRRSLTPNVQMRGAIAYALADDAIGLDRFREKYAAKMSD